MFRKQLTLASGHDGTRKDISICSSLILFIVHREPSSDDELETSVYNSTMEDVVGTAEEETGNRRNLFLESDIAVPPIAQEVWLPFFVYLLNAVT